MMARKEVQLAERLKRMEEAAKAEIQAYAAELAVKATAEIIASHLDAATNSLLIDATIKSVPENLSKAA
jgi:F-type H+-transporting ATPase subunit b